MEVNSVEDLMEDVKVENWIDFETGMRMLSVRIRCMAIPAKYSDDCLVLPQIFYLRSNGHSEAEEPTLIEDYKNTIDKFLRKTTVKQAFVLPRKDPDGDGLLDISQEMADEKNKRYAGVAEGTSPVDGYWVIPIAGFIRRPRPSDCDMVTSGLGPLPPVS